MTCPSENAWKIDPEKNMYVYITRYYFEKRMMDKPPLKKVLKRKHSAPFVSPLQKDSASRLPQVNQQSVEQLQEKLDAVNKEIEELESQGLKEEELQTHIDKLHEYNEIKDVGQLVLGRLANLEGVTTKDMYDKYGLSMDD